MGIYLDLSDNIYSVIEWDDEGEIIQLFVKINTNSYTSCNLIIYVGDMRMKKLNNVSGLDVGEPLGAEELLQDGGPVHGGRPQELGEVTLRQQHHLEGNKTAKQH